MKKVYQKIIDRGVGDCFKCCIASLLELDYDEVPNFVESEHWYADAIDFLREKGYDLSHQWLFNPNLMYLENASSCCFDGDMSFDRGSSILKVKDMEGLDGLFLATVYSPKFTSMKEPFTALHSVICDRDLNIVFDPNPHYVGIKMYPYSKLIKYNGIRDIMPLTKLKDGFEFITDPSSVKVGDIVYSAETEREVEVLEINPPKSLLIKPTDGKVLYKRCDGEEIMQAWFSYDRILRRRED